MGVRTWFDCADTASRMRKDTRRALSGAALEIERRLNFRHTICGSNFRKTALALKSWFLRRKWDLLAFSRRLRFSRSAGTCRSRVGDFRGTRSIRENLEEEMEGPTKR
jgi:hypothetical protein